MASELPWRARATAGLLSPYRHKALKNIMTSFLFSARRKFILKGLRCTNTLSENNHKISVTLYDRLAGHSCLETSVLL